MGLWILNLISNESLLTITPWILLIVGFLVEKHFVGRVTTFTNTLAINIHFSSISNLASFWIFYANIGLLFGIVAIISYSVSVAGYRLGLPNWYYQSNWAFCSIIIGILLLAIR